MKPQGVAIRKRTQIAMANRAMFIWVACASIIFGFALVGSIFLTQMLLFNERVIQAKSKTVSTLRSNNENIKLLESNIRALDTNQSLLDARASEDDKALQVILDALPSDVNSSALGASIRDKLLNDIIGLEITTLTVDPVPGIEALAMDSLVQDGSSASETSLNEITFRLELKCNTPEGASEEQKSIQCKPIMASALLRLEASIRTIDILSLKIQGADVMVIQGRGFFEQARVVELKDKTVK